MTKKRTMWSVGLCSTHSGILETLLYGVTGYISILQCDEVRSSILFESLFNQVQEIAHYTKIYNGIFDGDMALMTNSSTVQSSGSFLVRFRLHPRADELSQNLSRSG